MNSNGWVSTEIGSLLVYAETMEESDCDPKIEETQMHGSPTGGSGSHSGKIEGDGVVMERIRSSAAVRQRMLTIITGITLLQGGTI